MAKNTRPKQQRIDPRTVRRSGHPGRKVGSPVPVVKRAGAGDWIAGARIRTLPLGIAPVALGTATAYAANGFETFDLTLALLCLAVALFLQIGVNYANDYSDGVRGTDAYRVGPSRLTGSGAAGPRTVLGVALVFFALAGAAGLAIVVLTGYHWLIAVGVACMIAGWFYTGGRRPYGYYGLGEVFVFVFFGLVATAGTTFVQAGTVTLDSWLAGVAAGLFACAVLVSNNLRDLEQDRAAGKRTLTVLIGDLPSRILFAVLALAPYVVLIYFATLYAWAPYVYFVLFLTVPAVVIVLTAKTAKEFLLALALTSLSALVFGVGLAAAIAF